MRRLTGLVALCLLFAPLASGQAPTEPDRAAAERPAPEVVSPGSHALTAEDVGAFLDGIVPMQLAEDDIAGATVAVVKGGEVLFAKGYGYADYKNAKPVSADETLFRPGSISKLFVYTSVMQLAEQGKLDLDRDVNEYLDYKIPDAFDKPITLKNLMTHTAGFEEQVKDIFVEGDSSPNLRDYVVNHIPGRIFPPGTTPAYSNYGLAVSGYIVERVSGRPLADYIDENIFKPLGMARSTFVQPLPPALAPLMSSGYKRASDDPQPFEVIGPWPAGSLTSSATDMARFVIAHLQDGRFGAAQILRPETARLMHSRLFGLDDAANAMAYGFYEESRNGHRIIGHGGDTVCFHSDLHLIPDAGVGFFVSYNSAGRGEGSPRTVLWEAFLDRYFPYTPPTEAAPASAKADAEAVSGNYTLSRRSETSFLKSLNLIQQISVAAQEDGTIEVAALTGPNGKPKRWQAVAPMVFREVRGQDLLVFKPGEDGRMRMILPFPFFVGQRVGLLENQRLVMPVVVVSLLVMVLALVLWPVAALVRWRYGYKLESTPADRRLRWAVRAVLALNLLFTAAILGLTIYGLENLWVFTSGGSVWFHVIQAFGVLGAVGTLVVFYSAFREWRGKGRIWAKLHALVLALACLGFLWFVVAGNLILFRTNY